VWNLGDERSRPRRIDGGALLLDVDLSTDGRRLAGGTQEGTAFLVDLPRGGVRTLQPGDPNTADVVVDVALSPDGSAFAASLQNGAVLLEQATATQLARPLPNDAEPSIALDLAFSPDGGELAAGRVGGTIVLWDTRKRRLSRKLFRVHQTDVRAVDFSPDGELIASTGGESAATLRSVSEGSEAGEPMRASRPLTAMRFSPDGRLLVAGTTTGEVVIFDVESREPLGEPLITHTRSVYGVAFADNGRRVVSAGGDGRVLLWNVEPWANEGVLRERACSVVGRNLTRTEWEQFLPGKSYRRTCDEWPAAD
jgi:WD40 repeat protein